MDTKAISIMRARRYVALSLLGLSLSACGTTFKLPTVTPQAEAMAQSMFAQEAEVGPSKAYAVSPRQAAGRYQRVAARIEPVAEAFCRQRMAKVAPDYNCNVEIVVDTEMPVRNAYQTRLDDGRPIIAFTVPMLMDARNDHEIAFIMGHEYGHHIATHIDKARKQAVAGALIMGTIMAAGQAYANSNDPYRYTGNDSRDIENSVALGYALGDRAYSQSYELEADVIGTHIARAAGYDPVKGARYFAKPEDAKTETGKLSFWGTHPPDEQRLATVIQTNAEIDARQ